MSKKTCIIVGTLLCALLSACARDKNKDKDNSRSERYQKSYEVEDGVLTGNMEVGTEKSGYTGTGYVTGLEEDTDTCTIEIDVPKEARYDFSFRNASYSGYKENVIYVDEEKVGSISVKSEDFVDSVLQGIYLTSGKHKVTVKKSWGWIYLDSIEVIESEPVDPSIYEVDRNLIDDQATRSTKNLMNYLVDSYGEVILSGQTADEGMNSSEFRAIKEISGKVPAILGLDFIEYSLSRVAHGSKSNAVEHAIDFNKLGGIVTFCWHWNAPTKYLNNTSDNPWWSGFYTTGTNIDLAKIMSGEDEEGYKMLLLDIGAIAKELKRLQNADVPILWRPLHEASGGWFWWGAAGPEAYIQLWKLLYDQLTNIYDIHNLIWVWNGQDAAWYPGDNYVDIIGQDIYPGEKVYTSQAGKFLETAQYTSKKKIIAMTENGCLFDPDLVFRDETKWAWFTTWQDEFVVMKGTDGLSEQYTEADMVKKVYNHEKVITLDELPDWKHR